MNIEDDFKEILSEYGKEIYDRIYDHCKSLGIDKDIDFLQMAMLANAFDLYRTNALEVNKKGCTQKPEKGGWDQVSPAYIAMKNASDFILKHSDKFGLNPASRMKHFPKVKAKKKLAFE